MLQINFNNYDGENSAIHLNGTFFPGNISETNGNIEKICNKHINWYQAGHFPVVLVSIPGKLGEEKPVKKRRNNNILDFGLTVVCCFAITLIIERHQK